MNNQSSLSARFPVPSCARHGAVHRVRLLLAVVLCAVLGASNAAVTHRWQVDDSQITPVNIRAYQGETLSLEARLTSYGVPVTNVTTATFLWQTNGMASSWWQTNATVAAGLARATFSPAMNPGASIVRFFFSLTDATGGSYRPSGSISFITSPGSNPTTAVLPAPGETLDFAQVTVLNAPWCTLEAAQSAVSTGVNAALNAVSTLSNEVSTTYAKLSDIPTVPSLANYATLQSVSNSSASVLLAAEQSAASTYQPLASMSAYALKTELPTVPSLAPYATHTEVSNLAATVQLAAEQSAASTYQPLASMSAYALKTELPTVPSLAPYATHTEVSNLAASAQLAAEQSAASTYQPLASMSAYALKTELPTVPSLAPYATHTEVENAISAAVIGAGSSDYTLRLLSPDGSRFQTADGSIYQVTIAPASTNWYRQGYPDDLLTNVTATAWATDIERLEFTNNIWKLTEPLYGTYTANPAEGLAATNITLHNTQVLYVDLTYIRLDLPPHPVTNKIDQVLYESTGSQGDLIAATNATLNAAKAYTDSSIQGAGPVSPSIVTNISGRITSNVVTKAYVENLGISAGLTTNDVAGIVSGKRDLGDLVYGDWSFSGLDAGIYNNLRIEVQINSEFIPYNDYLLYDGNNIVVGKSISKTDEPVFSIDFSSSTPVRVVATRDRIALNSDLSSATNNLASLASLSSLSSTVSTVSSTAATLATQVSTIGAYLNAEDARFVSTNYNSATHMPEAYVEIKLTNNTWSTIWREMTRFNWLTNTYLPTNYASKAELDEKADRAWGYYDSHTGSYAPDGYTWLSSPRIAIAAGLAYQRTVTSEGAVWVLESNGLVTQTGGETNGFFRITDEEGNTQFEIVKGNKRTIGADASSCQVVAGFSPTKLQIGYSIQSDTRPTIEVTGSLSSPSWKSETDADCLANVTWSGSSGAYVAQVQAKTAQPSLFVRATYQSGGETYINNAAPVALNYLYLGGVKYAVSTNKISGHLVLTLTPSL